MDVPRETRDRFAVFESLVRRWNPRINLVSPSTLQDFETRHLADSIQIHEMAPHDATTWADLGSGGGFPGVVVAICRPDCRVTMVESDRRKAEFLRHAVRELSLNADIRAERIEDIQGIAPDVISARALAALPKLLSLCESIADPGTVFLFPKGERFDEELRLARRDWRFTEEIIPSKTRKGSVILRLRNVERA